MKRFFTKAKPEAKPLEHDSSLQFARKWQDLPPLKTPRRNCGVAMWGSDKIIVVGGFDEQLNILRSVEMYDISTGTRTDLPSLSQHKGTCAAIVVKNKLYVFGGISIVSHLSECEVLDLSLSNSQFTRLPRDLPQALSGAVAVSNGRSIYIIGGFNGHDYLNTVYVLDTRTNQWNDKLHHMKEKRSLPAVVIWVNTLVVVGGYNSEDQNKYLKSVETLDLAKGKWNNSILPMPSQRAGAVAFLEEGSSNLIIAGGKGEGDIPANAFLRYDGNSWHEYDEFPAMSNHSRRNPSIVVAASRKCLYYVDSKRKFKFLSFTTYKSVLAVHF